MLPIPPGDPIGLPSKMAVAAAVPTDSRSLGSFRPVDFLRLQEFTRRSEERAPDNHWFRTAATRHHLESSAPNLKLPAFAVAVNLAY